MSESTVEVNFALRIGEGTLKASINVPAGQTTLTAILPVIQNFDSNMIQRVVNEAAEAGQPVSCRAGCGACCRQMVPLSIFEAESLSEWFSTLPDERQRELEDRFAQGLTKLRDAGVLERIMSSGWGGEEKEFVQLAIDYFHIGVPCPFLENESCGIYPIRPLICREYLVTSPVEYCNDPSIYQISAINLPIRPSQALYNISRELTREEKGWMPLIFLLAWAKRGLKPGEYYTGTGEQVLHTFMNHLTTEPSPEAIGIMQPK